VESTYDVVVVGSVDWLEVHGRLHSSGVFDSPFTERVEISAPRFTP
jgi:hypothetical protein